MTARNAEMRMIMVYDDQERKRRQIVADPDLHKNLVCQSGGKGGVRQGHE